VTEKTNRLEVSSAISVPRRELRFSYARSSGPGGQNVNKVNSKVQLSWKPSDSEGLPDEVLQRLLVQQRNRINKLGELLITSERYRDREKNVDDCLRKLQGMLVRAARRPTPRKATKPTRGSQERRLREKRARSETKTQRRQRPTGD
jgi:ribosome-associated protein